MWHKMKESFVVPVRMQTVGKQHPSHCQKTKQKMGPQQNIGRISSCRTEVINAMRTRLLDRKLMLNAPTTHHHPIQPLAPLLLQELPVSIILVPGWPLSISKASFVSESRLHDLAIASLWRGSNSAPLCASPGAGGAIRGHDYVHLSRLLISFPVTLGGKTLTRT